MSEIKVIVEHAHVHIEAGDAVNMARHAGGDIIETILDKIKHLLRG